MRPSRWRGRCAKVNARWVAPVRLVSADRPPRGKDLAEILVCDRLVTQSRRNIITHKPITLSRARSQEPEKEVVHQQPRERVVREDTPANTQTTTVRTTLASLAQIGERSVRHVEAEKRARGLTFLHRRIRPTFQVSQIKSRSFVEKVFLFSRIPPISRH